MTIFNHPTLTTAIKTTMAFQRAFQVSTNSKARFKTHVMVSMIKLPGSVFISLFEGSKFVAWPDGN